MTKWMAVFMLLMACERTETPKALEASTPIVAPSLPASVGPPPPPAPLVLDASCNQDDECVPAPACCPPPCTSHVINRRDLPKARAALSCRRT